MKFVIERDTPWECPPESESKHFFTSNQFCYNRSGG